MAKKVVKKETEKECYHCKRMINLKRDKYVVLSTINIEKQPDEHNYYHFQCWINYFNSKVIETAKNNVMKMQEQVMNSPMIKSMLKGIQGLTQ